MPGCQNLLQQITRIAHVTSPAACAVLEDQQCFCGARLQHQSKRGGTATTAQAPNARQQAVWSGATSVPYW